MIVHPIQSYSPLGKESCFIQHKGSSVDPRRQTAPHAHSINLDADNNFAFVADLGLDKILVYRFEKKNGILIPQDNSHISVPPASGPRHFTFHPSGRFAYANEEMTSQVTSFTYNSKTGKLTIIEHLSTLPKGFKGNNSTAQILTSPDGKFLYCSNRGHDSLAIYAIDQQTGKLTPKGHQSTRGKTPRNFQIDPTGNFLIAANQSSNSLVVFRIDRETGLLTQTDKQENVSRPVCVKFLQK